MTPAAFERAVASGRAPALALPRRARRVPAVRRRSSRRSLPSASPRSSPARGPDVHHIPHLVWWHREERRIVEYGSSFAAIRAAGMAQSLLDTIFNMNQQHLAPRGGDGLRGARGRGARHGRGEHHVLPRQAPLPAGAARGDRAVVRAEALLLLQLLRVRPDGRAVRHSQPRAPARSTPTPLPSGAGSSPATASTSSPTTSPDFDFASHAEGPDGAAEDAALAQIDAAIGALLDAAGGPDEFLERYAVVLLSDHGQTQVERAARLEEPFADLADEVVVTASNRAGQVYLLPGARVEPAELARRLDGFAAVEVTLRRRGTRWSPAGDGARRAGGEARASGRGVAGPLGAREPERGRAARLGGGGLGVRRSRRTAPRRRRQPRLARCGRLRRPAAHDRHRRGACTASPTSLPPCSSTSASRCPTRWRRRSVSADERRDGGAAAPPARHRGRARARRDGARAARALRAGRAAGGGVRRCRAADRRRPDDLAAVHGRADLRAARAARRGAGPRRRHRAPATRPPCWPSSRPRCTRSSGSRSSPSARGRASRRPGTGSGCSFHVGDGTPRLPEFAPFAAIAVAAAAPEPPPALYEQLEPRGRLVVPVGGRRTSSGSRSSCRRRRARPSCAPFPAASCPSSAQVEFAQHPPGQTRCGTWGRGPASAAAASACSSTASSWAGPSTCCSTATAWHVLGFVVRCGDESPRFLAVRRVPAAATTRSRSRPRSCCSRTSSSIASGRLVPRRCSAARSRASGERSGRSDDLVVARDGMVESSSTSSDGARPRGRPRARDRARLRGRGSAALLSPATVGRPAATLAAAAHARARASLRSAATGCSSAKFCAVGAVGYLVNLAVYDALLHAGLHYLVAATCSFLVAVTSNYTWNRLWTFRDRRGRRRRPGDALLRRLARVARREPRSCSMCSITLGRASSSARRSRSCSSRR